MEYLEILTRQGWVINSTTPEDYLSSIAYSQCARIAMSIFVYINKYQKVPEKLEDIAFSKKTDLIDPFGNEIMYINEKEKRIIKIYSRGRRGIDLKGNTNGGYESADDNPTFIVKLK